MEGLQSIVIDLDNIEEGLKLTIDARKDKTLFDVDDSSRNNEARYQIVEGCFYDYEFNIKDFYFEKSETVQPHSRNKNVGTIAPNIYVGTLTIPIYSSEKEIGSIEFEVQSVKSGYRQDYRDMLEFITDKCTDLLMQFNSPVHHIFTPEYTKDQRILYQRFAFLKSIIDTDEFNESVHRIVSNPVTHWKDISEEKDIRRVRRFRNSNLRELVTASNPSPLHEAHFLNELGLRSVPARINSIKKTDTVDTPENRFIKYALEVFLFFVSDIQKLSEPGSQLYKESSNLVRNLESYLQHSVFKEISRPTTLQINSPVLQRKEGYREVLRVWLMFDLAAKLIWTGGWEDVYKGGKKDIAVLYEYWLFFILLDLFKSVFEIEPKVLDQLIQTTDHGLNLSLKQGKHTALAGIYDSGTRKLNVRFCYNRSFGGPNPFPDKGSWTTSLRPDYTLSFWPVGINEDQAEEEEIIVHIHFDAKYRVENYQDFLDRNFLLDQEEDLNKDKNDNRKGYYKNADLLKMHAYRDAIRRTGGAYVLYPGDKSLKRQGFHEIIPGLGAFPVRPSKTESGITELRSFIEEALNHFINRASQREKMASKVYTIHKDKPFDPLNESLPEAFGNNRNLIPDETFVLVGYCKSAEQYSWITKNKKYNFRMGLGRGSLALDKNTVESKYLLLYGPKQKHSGDLWKIISNGPKIFSEKDMLKLGYSGPSRDYYLVIEIEKVSDPEFQNVIWEYQNLEGYTHGRFKGVPFSISLADLMKVKVKK